jgi:hypothetical protein
MLILGWWNITHKLLSEYVSKKSKLLKDNLIWKINLDMGTAHPLNVNNETGTVSEWKMVDRQILKGGQNVNC